MEFVVVRDPVTKTVAVATKGPKGDKGDPGITPADPWKDVGYGIPFAASTSITGAGTYPGLGPTTAAAAVQSGSLDFDPAYWLLPGATGLKLRCIYRVATNAVGPGRDLTFDLRSIDGVAGGSAANTITGLTLVTGTQTTIPSPSANSRGTAVVLPQIDAPAAGLYSVCLTVDGGFALNSRIILFQRVQVKNVFA